MSLENTHSIPCPECGNVQDVVVWSSLNVQVSPEAKDDFFNGKINTFECEKCGHRAGIAVPFMYHDMELGFCVQYYPLEAMDEAGTLEGFYPDGTSNVELFGGMPVPDEVREKTLYMTRPHVVFGMQEALFYVIFREKLAAFHGGESQ